MTATEFDRCAPDDPRLPDILTLVQHSFAYMESRIDPPSSMHRLTVDAIAEQTLEGEVWVKGTPPEACVFFTPKPGRLYIGKMAVADGARRKGIARRIIDLAEARAAALGLPELELQSRIELVENHQAFSKLGFTKTGEDSHAGFDRPTSIIMRRPVAPRIETEARP